MNLESSILTLQTTSHSESENFERLSRDHLETLMQSLDGVKLQLEQATHEVLTKQILQLDRQQDSLQQPISSMNQKLKDISERQRTLCEKTKVLEDCLLLFQEDRRKSVTLIGVLYILLQSLVSLIFVFVNLILGRSDEKPVVLFK